MKIEKLAESEELEVYTFEETMLICAVYYPKDKKARIVNGNDVIQEYEGLEKAEDLERITEENKFELMVRTATALTIKSMNQKHE